MSDRKIICQDCGTEFTFTEGEQRFYEKNGYVPPKRCKYCRKNKRKEAQNYGSK